MEFSVVFKVTNLDRIFTVDSKTSRVGWKAFWSGEGGWERIMIERGGGLVGMVGIAWGKDEGKVEMGVIACRRMVGGEGSLSKVIYGRDKDLYIFKLYEV